MSDPSCPADHQLLALTLGEPVAPDLEGHANACPLCSQEVQRLQAEVSTLRAAVTSIRSAIVPPDVPVETRQTPPPPLPGQETQALPPPSSPSAGPEAEPTAIGKYPVVGLLGKGGQALVYRALHPTIRNQQLVIKISRRRLAEDRSVRERFLAEAKLLADLDHPNLVRIYDLDFHEDRPFLVMEYVPGRNLEEYAKEEHPSPSKAAALVAQAARALAVAHRRGIIHQDLKPQNILIDETDRPRIIDFGLARLRDHWAEASEQPEGGTLNYMAPEQARGEHDQINQRSDIFGLGGVLYYLLVGKAPFAGADALSVLNRAQRCEFKHEPLQEPRISRSLRRICLRAMAADPRQRYARAEDLAEDLERACQARWPARKIGAVAAATLLVGLLAWVFVFNRSVPADPQHPQQPPPPQFPVFLQSLLSIRRGEQGVPLKEALPLRAGDLIRIECSIPPIKDGVQPVVFWLDTDGQIKQVQGFTIDRGESYDRLSYPRSGHSTLEGRSGTEFLLICAHRTAPNLAEITRHFDGRPWPALQPDQLVLMSTSATRVESSRGLGPTVETPQGSVADRVERLRTALADNFDFFVGVAFPHVNPSIMQVRIDEAKDLRDALPLQEDFPVLCQAMLPDPTMEAALFWFDCRGSLREFPLARDSTGVPGRWSYPQSRALPLRKIVGPSGTQLVLICGREGKAPPREEVERLLNEHGPWPELPIDTLFIWQRDWLEEQTAFKQMRITSDAPREFMEKLDKLRLQLRERFDFVAGVAFAHDFSTLLHVYRGKETHYLESSLPLKSSDRVRLRANYSRDSKPAAFQLAPNGQLRELKPLKTVSIAAVDMVAYPSVGTMPVEDEPGVHVFLLFAYQLPDSPRAAVEGVLKTLGRPPELPPTAYAWLRPGSVDVRDPGRALGVPEAEWVTQFRRWLDDLREALRKDFQLVEGVAVSVQKETPTPP